MINTVQQWRPSALKTDHLGSPNCRVLIRSDKAEGGRSLLGVGMRVLLLSCVYGFCVSAGFQSLAFAQTGAQTGAQTTQTENADLPIQSTTATSRASHLPAAPMGATEATGDASFELEVLGPTKSEYLQSVSGEDSASVARNPEGRNPNGRNQWDRSTLTQSTGLGAASFYTQANPISETQRVVSQNLSSHGSLSTRRAIDTISTEDLLDVAELSQTIENVLPYNADGVVTLGTGLRGSILDDQNQNMNNGSMFRLGLGEQLCLGPKDDCRMPRQNHIEMGFAKNITHGKQNGFNLQLTPRAGVRFNEDSKSALVGALVRIGDNLRDTSAHMKSNAWYLFAGADAEAVRYNQPSLGRQLNTGEFHLQNRFFVGDAQAGLGYRFGDADLALTYFKRQTNAENYRYDEDAAALSITWKR